MLFWCDVSGFVVVVVLTETHQNNIKHTADATDCTTSFTEYYGHLNLATQTTTLEHQQTYGESVVIAVV